GGYRAIAAAAPASSARPAAATGASGPAAVRDRDAELVARLGRGSRGDDALGPHVWRAADRDLRAAEGPLRELLDAPPPGAVDATAWQHSVASALVRCATAASLPRLEALAGDARTRPHVRDIAR